MSLGEVLWDQAIEQGLVEPGPYEVHRLALILHTHPTWNPDLITKAVDKEYGEGFLLVTWAFPTHDWRALAQIAQFRQDYPGSKPILEASSKHNTWITARGAAINTVLGSNALNEQLWQIAEHIWSIHKPLPPMPSEVTLPPLLVKLLPFDDGNKVAVHYAHHVNLTDPWDSSMLLTLNWNARNAVQVVPANQFSLAKLKAYQENLLIHRERRNARAREDREAHQRQVARRTPTMTPSEVQEAMLEYISRMQADV